MSDTFDPYHKWLSIPPHQQPPNHYRLLGINGYESDPEVIANAADRLMKHLRTFQVGERSQLSQKLLNEVANAKICLLDQQSKAQYDAELVAQSQTQKNALEDTVAPPPQMIKEPFVEEPAKVFGEIATANRASRMRGQLRSKSATNKTFQRTLTVAGLITVAGVLLFMLLLFRGGKDADRNQQMIAQREKAQRQIKEAQEQGARRQSTNGHPLLPDGIYTANFASMSANDVFIVRGNSIELTESFSDGGPRGPRSRHGIIKQISNNAVEILWNHENTNEPNGERHIWTFTPEKIFLEVWATWKLRNEAPHTQAIIVKNANNPMPFSVNRQIAGDGIVLKEAQEQTARIARVEADRPTKVTYWPNGQKRLEEHWKDGKREGLATRWNENGKKYSEVRYKNGERDGLETWWRENGQKEREYHYKNDKLDGPWTHWHYNGQKREQRHYKNDKLDGLATRWYENSQKKYEGHFKNGKQDGLATRWYENSQKKGEYHFKNGKQDGLSTTWHKNGKKELERHHKNGKYDGLQTQWLSNGQKWREVYYNNGQKEQEKHYKNDELDGLCTWWYENGQKGLEEHYKDGKQDGLWTWWNEDGKKIEEQHYKNDKLDGLWTKWDRNGKKWWERHYKDGNLVSASAWKPDGKPCPITNVADGSGIVAEWHKNGEKKSERHYKNGKEEGLRTMWYENGQKRADEKSKNGKIDGLWTSWYKNGQKSEEVHFKNNKSDGLWTKWDRNGKKVRERYFKNGEKQWEKHYKDGKEVSRKDF